MNLPLSVEDLVNKKKEAQLQNEKPRFIPKSKRLGTSASLTGVKSGTTTKPTTANTTTTKPPSPETYKRRASNAVLDQPEKRKRSKNKFTFGWDEADDTYRLADDEYLPADSSRISASASATEGQAERARRMRAVAEQQRKLSEAHKKADDIHWTQKSLQDMTVRDWRILKEDFRISTRASQSMPIRFWRESNIPPNILDVVDVLGFKEPTPVQRAAIPVAMSGQDVVGIAETGSGKTASFLIPVLSHILSASARRSPNFSPYCLILVPTRELAQQIESETNKFCSRLRVRCVSLVGGHSLESQAWQLQQDHAGRNSSGSMAEIVIATPGRLIESLGRRMLGLGDCTYVVLDEADRMIDMGFEDQVAEIFKSLPSNESRHTMMFTATWPRAIERMAEKYLNRPGHVTVGSLGQATDRVDQRIEYITAEAQRNTRLLELLRQYRRPVIVFANLKNTCDSLVKLIGRTSQFRCAVMHGGKSQDQREAALQQLRSGQVDCLIATDVAGRGIDVPNVSLVVNYQMPKSLDTYTHRIGRTGRAGKSGVAISFVGPEDEDIFFDLKTFVRKSSARGSTPLPEQVRHARPKLQNITG